MRSLYQLVSVGLFTAASAQLPSAPPLDPIPSYMRCPPDGPLLPRPTNLARSKYVQDAASDLAALLDSAVKGDIKAGWVIDNVTFSLTTVSPNGGPGADHGKPFWEYHHRGINSTLGSPEVTGDTQYLIGSVSKVFSDLLLLKSGINLQAPVTHYLPQPVSDGSPIRWENITLEALADHLAGIPPNNFYEFYFLNSLHESLGLPHLNDSVYPSCGVSGLNGQCTRQQVLEGLLSKEPVVPVNSKPVYSQLSFTLFAFCLEAATGKNYSQLLDEFIYKPMNLRNSGVSPGDSARAAIPNGMSSWGSDYGFNTPGGGLYSSSNDLSSFVNAILDRSILQTPADVRKWLKPTSMTSSPTALGGKPWEILRTTNLTPDYPHTIDIYGKSGGAMGYMSQIAVIDQYGVGVVVTTAGPVDSMNILYRAVVATMIPAIEEEARLHARRFSGNWTTRKQNNNSSTAPIHLELTLDNGPGLKLGSLACNGSSIIEAIQTIWEIEYLPVGFGILSPDFRIYPTEVEAPVSASESRDLLGQAGIPYHDKVELIRQDCRISLEIVPVDGQSMSDLPGQDALTTYCGAWQMADWPTYGGISLDKIVFVLEKQSGKMIGVEVPSLRGGILVHSP